MAQNADKPKEPHNCNEHRYCDGGQKINRGGMRVWVRTYYCSVCGARLDVEEEILD